MEHIYLQRLVRASCDFRITNLAFLPISNESVLVVLAIPIAIFGVFTLLNLVRRGLALTKIDSTCRVMGGQRWTVSNSQFHLQVAA